MIKEYQTKLKGIVAMTDSYHEAVDLQKQKRLYKFIWVRAGTITVEIDHQPITLKKNQVISLSHLQHLDITNIEGEYLTILFNSNFYCIYGNDQEVSCSGFLFNSTTHVLSLDLSDDESEKLGHLLNCLGEEFNIVDRHQDEMLRIHLKSFIIQCTRIARKTFDITQEKERSFEVVRKYFNLVDEHFREKKQVQNYADMLHKSPKTLTNIFSMCKQPAPLRIIHERLEAEAKRLLLYSNKSIKQISDELGFDDPASFSRFFKKITGKNASEFRQEELQANEA